MHKRSVGIIGASGYAGAEATRLLALHPEVELAFLSGDRWAGDTVEKRLGLRGATGRLRYETAEQAAERGAQCEAVLLATPAETSLQLAPALRAKGVKVVDLSGAFRLQDAALYPAFYNFTHSAPEALAAAVYGLPELSRAQLQGAGLIANPGCYATAVALALAPLCAAGLIDPGSLIVDAASGVTGAGRKATEDFSFAEVTEDFRAYRVLKHQHTPEMAQTLSRAGNAAVRLTFTAHLLPVKRGILSTAHALLKPGATAAAVKDAFERAYRAEPFITLASSPEEVALKRVTGTNQCQVAFAAEPPDPDGRARLLVFSALDNLVKGAAGQAVQNLNLALGLEETSGLFQLGRFHA